MRKFKPGARVRVEVDAEIVEQAEKSNPYWYIVRFADGREEIVNLARINWLSDEPQVTRDNDGSVQIITNRLTAEGARHLAGILADYASNPTPLQEESEASNDL